MKWDGWQLKKNINHITHITWRFFDHGTFDGWFQIHGEFHQFHQLLFKDQFRCLQSSSLQLCRLHIYIHICIVILKYIDIDSDIVETWLKWTCCWNSIFYLLQGSSGWWYIYIYIHTYTMFDFVVFRWFTQYDQMCGSLIIHMFGCCSMICFVFPVLSYVMTHIWGSKFHRAFVG